ncbi:MAG: hypothetical protein AVDCRST_MAG08-428, partial [uncultured Acetobacteraceae bacterium]
VRLRDDHRRQGGRPHHRPHDPARLRRRRRVGAGVPPRHGVAAAHGGAGAERPLRPPPHPALRRAADRQQLFLGRTVGHRHRRAAAPVACAGPAVRLPLRRGGAGPDQLGRPAGHQGRCLLRGRRPPPHGDHRGHRGHLRLGRGLDPARAAEPLL